MTLVQLAERILAATAVIGSSVYVLSQALYIEFYDDFGVRPEQVGLDRTAVLSRAAWFALAVFIVATVFIWLGTTFALPSWPRLPTKIFGLLAMAVALLALVGYVQLRYHVEALAEDVTKGRSVAGIAWIVPLIDVRAHPARVTWLDATTSTDPPTPLGEVMYLGRGDMLAVFYTEACSSILLPADRLRIELLDQGPETSPEDRQLDWDPRKCSQ